MPRSRHAGAVAITAIGVGVLFAVPASADPAEPAATTPATTPAATIAPVVLAAESQPVPDRPVLAGLKASAARQGISLEAAVDAYVAERTGPRERDASGDLLTPDIAIDDLEVSELEDLRYLAKLDGTGLAEAIDRHGWQSDYMEIREKLRESFPAEFAGAERESDGSGVWFGFKDEVPDEAVRLARTLPVTVRLQGGQGFSETEIAQAKTLVHADINKRAGVAGNATSYDVRTGAINVEVEYAATARSAEQPEALATVAATAVPLAGRMHVNVTKADLDSGDEDKIVRGGAHFDDCTTGFILRGIPSPHHKRVATAGHCGKPKSYRYYQNHSSDGGATSTKRMWWHYGKWGDLAYYTTGAYTGSPTFYSAWHTKRSVTSRSGRPSVGDYVCHFGKSSGRSCSYVHISDLDYSGVEGRVVVRDYVSEGGDSGGPWYYGNKAIGIHSGWKSSFTGRRYSTFTPVYLFRNRNFDVYLK
ncbi:hypothetical protein FAF44_34655 [Nonomuraea sp. MG754425]|uniref:S1 family peptidase n=1 Tax=Nonomuraea sp. MG754425 TaxID=2570319 RepID=UPI001F34E5AF|nr:S1 family peptidase [Nonomuraea sp. MG754425]MCF6473491.1 hypothetical protein [Nonomuraea sp. MG754425]